MNLTCAKKCWAFLAVVILVFSFFSSVTVPIGVSERDPEGTGFPYPGDDWAWDMIGTGHAHQIGEYGEGVRVAVLDTGIDYEHPDLEDKMWDGIGYDFVDSDEDPMDEHGHGTHVAGIVSSVAPEAELMALRVIEERGGDWVDVSRAVEYARENGADIISMSFGGQQNLFTPAFEFQMERAYEWDDILHVAAAGNDDDVEEFYPAAYGSVISVSAVNSTRQKAHYSNHGDWIEMTAPGGGREKQIYSTELDGTYGNKIGTSMAAPFVTGAAALRRGAYPEESNEEVRETLQETAIDLGNEEYYGHGLVNAYRAAGGEVPTPVEEIKPEPDDGRVELSWSEPWHEGSSPIEGYRIYRGSEKDDLEMIDEVDEDQFHYEDTAVQNENVYHYSITAFNDIGESLKLSPVRATPRDEPIEPYAPENVETELLEDGIDIRWDKPIDDGGSEIDNYKIYRQEKEGEMEFLIELDGEMNSHLDENIYPGYEYRYSVSAVNEVGEGGATNSTWIEVPHDHVDSQGDGGLEEILPDWLSDGEIPLIPSILVLLGLLFFILFAAALHRREKNSHR